MANNFWDNLTKYFTTGVNVGNKTVKASMNPFENIKTIQTVNREAEKQSTPKTSLDDIVDQYEAKTNKLKSYQSTARKQTAAQTIKSDPFNLINSFKAISELAASPTSYDSRINQLNTRTKDLRAQQQEMRNRITLDGYENASRPTVTPTNTTGKDSVIAGKSTGAASNVLFGDLGNYKYNFMTAKERNTYFYLQQTNGQDEADNYLDALDGELTERLGGAISEVSKDNPFMSTATSLIAGNEAYTKGLEQTAKRALGYEEPVGQLSMQKAFSEMNPQLEGAQKVLSDIGYTTGNILPSAAIGIGTAGAGAAPALANLAGSAAMGLSVFGNDYAQAREAGATDDEALAYSAVNTALEVGLQYALGGIKGVSAGGVSKIFGKTFKSMAAKLAKTPAVAQFFVKMAAQGGNEALEEWIQAAVDPIVRNLTLNENNEFDPLSQEALYSALLGFITANAMNAPFIPQDIVSSKWPTTTDSISSPQGPISDVQVAVQPIIPVEQEIAADNVMANDTGINDLPYDNTQQKTSSFAQNVANAQVLNKDTKALAADVVQKYSSITNEETLNRANAKLQIDGQNAIDEWNGKDIKSFDAEDVALGFLLLDKYQNEGNAQGVVRTARKLRQAGTKSGQTVQAYAILGRLTPEGMVKYAQAELDEFFEKYSKHKTSKWIDANKTKYDLNQEDIDFIYDRMNRVQGLPEDSAERVQLISDVLNRLQDKMPSSLGSKLRTWQRISLLFNPKTIIRNISGNAVMLPLAMTADVIATPIDKAISKKTGVRTTGLPKGKIMIKGGWKGLKQALSDYKNNINRNAENNKWEVQEGSAFNPEFANTRFGKGVFSAINRLDKLTNMLLDAGDRPFFYAFYDNSIENQMRLNDVSEPTPDMMEIAQQEALQRTWQDNNGFTRVMSKVRSTLNGNKDFGFGTILMPFVKTPANLTKAIFDFSPVGLTKALANDLTKFMRTVENGTATAIDQKRVVNNIGKGVTGTALMMLGYALAANGLISGSADEDKDKASFDKNVLGLQPYSVKIGDKTYTYNWLQPIGANLAISADIANIVKNNRPGENVLLDVLNSVTESVSTGINTIVDLSLVQGIADLMSSDDKVIGLINTLSGLPAQFVPTLFSQFAQLVDPIVRKQYVSGGDVSSVAQTGANKVLARIPGVSSMLEPSVDTFGRDIQRFGGDNSLFNVFVNPSNVAKVNQSSSSKAISDVYDATGENSVLPRTAPTTVNDGDNTYKLTQSEKTQYQKTMGQTNEKIVTALSKNNEYNNLTDSEKAAILTDVTDYANAVAKREFLKSKGEDYDFQSKWMTADNVPTAIVDNFITNRQEKANSEARKQFLSENGYSSVVYEYEDQPINADYSNIPANPTITGANKVSKDDIASRLTSTTLQKLNDIGMNPQDYYYIDERESAIDTVDKIDWYSSLGLDPAQIAAAVKNWDLTEKQEASMTLASDIGIDENTFIKIYTDTRGSMEGTKKELNQQLAAYLDTTSLTDAQKSFMYNSLEFSQKQYKAGTEESSSGSSGGGASSSIPSPSSVKSFALDFQNREVPKLDFDAEKIVDDSAYEQQYTAIKNSPFYKSKQKAGMIKNLKERYNK